MSKIVIIILLLIIIAGGGYFGYQWWQENKQSETTLSPSQNYIEIKELGFKIPVDSQMANEIVYNVRDLSTSFSTKTIGSLFPSCSMGLFHIVKIPGTPSNPTDIEEAYGSPASDYFEGRIDCCIKQFDGFFLMWTGPQSPCAFDDQAYELQGELIQVIKNGFQDIILIE